MNVHTKTKTPQRVSERENRKVGGEALVHKTVRESRETRVEELRAREAAFWDSLPNDPTEALSAVSKKLPAMEDYESPAYAVRVALVLTHELAGSRFFDGGSEDLNDAMYWLACRALDGLDQTEADVDRARAIASKLTPTHRPFKA
ncbi:MAG TPA: hypothetical protein DEO85_14920 [Maritimibacter sp.]|nr:hypothetical protein [Maritimibacter sp.]